jgi:FkbM family methyltransferase
MNAKILYASSSSHENLWKPLSLFNKNQGSDFIFSTSENDENPIVIIELEYPIDFSSDEQELSLNLYNRNLSSCTERVIGLEISTSKNMYEWRKHSFTLGEEFIFEQAPLQISLSVYEKYLMISRKGGSGHFHIGGINLNKNCSANDEIFYDVGFYKFSKRYKYLSNSQVFQDIFALYNCGFQENYFLEFGANDGVALSNTILLESLGWNGIIGEALNRLYMIAKMSRQCEVVEGALAHESGVELQFYDQNLYSSAVSYSGDDMHAEKRKLGKLCKVQTVRIDELLEKYDAPNTIGFFSLDVEGAEVEVLETFPFDRYFVQCAAIEHNHTEQEVRIDRIMAENGFKRVLKVFSGHDGFYVNKKHVTPNWTQSEFLQKRPNFHIENLISKIDAIFKNN